jgi:nucleotide-binding universal stress UspA family protein
LSAHEPGSVSTWRAEGRLVIRRILVALDGSPGGEAAITLALEWARRFEAELLGLGVLDEPAIQGSEAIPRLAEAHGQIRTLLQAFDRRCGEARVRATSVEGIGQPHEQIVLEAQGCDIVMLGREASFHFETPERPDRTLSQVLRSSPRPVVVIPPDPQGGEGVLVAYGGGREIARTLHAVTLLGLAGNEAIELLAVATDRAEAEDRLRRAGALLTAHGVRTSLHAVASEHPAAEVILDEVRRRRPRLLVMGAHGQHPVRDLFFTSVTRAVMKKAPVPVVAGA